MKRWMALAMVVVFCLLALGATAEEFPVEFKWDKPIFPDVKPEQVVKIPYLDPPNPWIADEHGMAVVVKNVVERGTKGKIRVELYPNGQIGKESTMASMLIQGAVQCTIMSEGIIPTFYAPIQVLSTPYVFKTYTVAYRVLDGAFGKELSEDMAKTAGVRILGFGENGGFRNFTTNVRPIHSPADMRGIKMRTMEHAGHMAIVNSLGGIATPVPWAELYTSLKTNVVGGQENSIPVINFGKLYEVQDYLTLDGHVYSIDFVLVNEKWFKSLSKEYQEIWKDAGYQAAVHGRGISRILEWEKLAFFENTKQYKEIYLPSAAEKDAFAKIAQPAYLKWYMKEVDPKGIWSDKLFKAVAEAEMEMAKQ